MSNELIEKAYHDGHKDGWNKADACFMQTGRYEVAERARALVEATMHAVNEGKSPDASILFHATLDYLAVHIPDYREDEHLRCRQCGGIAVKKTALYVSQPGMNYNYGPFCDSECMRKHYEATEMACAINAVRGCRP